jgi:hypothetical protein
MKGVTERKARATANANSRFPEGMTERKARANASATADSRRE